MRVLITGATGFLGRYVVAEAVRRGHEVRALVRPSRELAPDFFPTGVSVARADVRNARSLPSVLEGIDAVIHLAACVVGDDDSQFASTVVGTEKLLNAMVEQNISRLVHCSTFSVYDWRWPKSHLDENTPLESDLYARDGYAISKTWQERLVRRIAQQHDWQLTVLRPGFIWGPGGELIAGIGQSVGKLHLVFGPRRDLPLTYVENCAECFLTALESPAAAGQAYNVVDSPAVSAWRYMGECQQTGVVKGWRLPVPYYAALSFAKLASWGARFLFGPTAKLPGLFVPIKFRSRFRPLRFPNRKVVEHLGWRPRWDFSQAWSRITSGQAQASLKVPAPQTAPQTEDSLV